LISWNLTSWSFPVWRQQKFKATLCLRETVKICWKKHTLFLGTGNKVGRWKIRTTKFPGSGKIHCRKFFPGLRGPNSTPPVISLSFWSFSISYSSFILSSLLSVSLSFPLFRFHPPFQVNRIPNFAILVCSCFHVRLRVESFNVGKVQSPTSMYCEADFFSNHFLRVEKGCIALCFYSSRFNIKLSVLR
jgi:hypothetical protein